MCYSLSLIKILFIFTGEQQTSTTITLTVERQHRGAILECVAQNSKIPNSAISDQIKLDVHCKRFFK
jgi:ribosomal protein S12